MSRLALEKSSEEGKREWGEKGGRGREGGRWREKEGEKEGRREGEEGD
jgi:hypothetical protein